MKVLFIYPDLMEGCPDFPGHYYEGVGSLSGWLKSKGHRTGLIHIIRRPKNRAEFLERVRGHEPQLIAYSCTSLQFMIVKETAGWIREAWPELPVICGGVHPTLMPEETLAVDAIDMVCVGEGEYALAEVAARIERGDAVSDIPNIWTKLQGRVVKTPVRPPPKSLDDLPFADRSIFDYPSLWWERNGTADVMASRGCPYHCPYCCNDALRKAYDKTPPGVRRRSVGRLIEELQKIRADYPFVRSINFDDDILFVDKKWAREFAERYPREVGLPYFCNMRPNLVTEEFAEFLRVSGCREVRIGLESGNAFIRNEVLNRNMPEDKIFEACRLLREAGIPVRTFNIIGIPEEEPSNILDTIRMNAELGIEDPQHTIFYPFAGTELHARYRGEGLLLAKDMTDYYTGTSVTLPHVSDSQLQMFQTDFRHFMRLYAVLGRAPQPVRQPLTKALNAFLASQMAPGVFRALHRAARFSKSLVGRLHPADAGAHRTPEARSQPPV